MNVAARVCRDYQRPAFDRSLPNEPLAQSELPGLVRTIERKTTDANQTSTTLIGDIESSIEQRDGFREARKQAFSNRFKILGVFLIRHSGLALLFP
jgi:hypothetical protein